MGICKKCEYKDGETIITAENLNNIQDAILALEEQVESGGGSGGGSGAPGKDGFSPAATVTQTAAGAVITITDKDGTTTATITNGKDGSPGQPGKDGSDGADGSPGQPGADGNGIKSAVLNADYTLTLTFDDGTSYTTPSIRGAAGKDGAAGTAGKDGSNGQPGADGVSPTVSVSKSGKVTTVSITDKNGTKTATINDGADGSPGAAGSAGKDGTSVTVKSVSESTADGGSNVVTFSDGKTLTVKNGSKGSSGTNGTNGVSVSSVTQTTTSSADGGSNVMTVTLSNGTTSTFTVKNGSKGSTGATGATGAAGAAGKNGADGYTPVRGTDYWTEADKVEIVQRVIETLGGNPIFGIVDENNNIVVSGDLPDGTYSVKYEMENGSKVNIGNLVIDTNVYYTVTNTLTQCTNSNSATKVVQGSAYSATITAKSGYELKSVTATMGGTAVSVSNGKINIASVTGNIVITAVAEEIKAAYTNLANPSSSDWWADSAIGSDGTQRTGKTGYAVSNFIGPVNVGDVIYIKGVDLTGTIAEYRCAPYKSDKTVHGSYGVGALSTLGGLSTKPITAVTVTATGGQFTNNQSDIKYWRIGGKLNGSASDVIITINEPIS